MAPFYGLFPPNKQIGLRLSKSDFKSSLLCSFACSIKTYRLSCVIFHTLLHGAFRKIITVLPKKPRKKLNEFYRSFMEQVKNAKYLKMTQLTNLKYGQLLQTLELPHTTQQSSQQSLFLSLVNWSTKFRKYYSFWNKSV